MIKYSIIIPVYNQLEELKWHHKFFTTLNNERQDFEVLYMDDGSARNVGEFLARAGHQYLWGYNWVADEGFRVCHAKNRGIRQAQGEWCLILDGDTFIDNPNTLKAYDEILSEDACYFGKRYAIDFDRVQEKVGSGVDYKNGKLIETSIEQKDWRGELKKIPPHNLFQFSGANFVCKTKSLKEVGYCVDDWVGYGLDDYYFAIEWLLSGRKFLPVNDSIAFHAASKPRAADPHIDERFNKFLQEKQEELNKIFREYQP